jgi:hypothetical protein
MVEQFKNHKITYSEASHLGVCFILLNSRKELLSTPFHCKDFFNEIWYSYFHSKSNCSVYGYNWKEKDNKKITPIVTMVAFQSDGDSQYINEIYNLKNKQQIGDYIDDTLQLLGLRNAIPKIRVYDDRVEMDIKTYILKYPTVNSILSYILRTSLSAGDYKVSNPFELTKLLIGNDGTYYTQHKDFLRILNEKKFQNKLKYLRWSYFSDNNTVKIPMKMVNGETIYLKPPVHNNSGFCNFVRLVDKNYLKELLKD